MKQWLVSVEIVAHDCLLAVCAALSEEQALNRVSDALDISVDDLVAIPCRSEQNAQKTASEGRVPYLIANAKAR